MLTSKKPLLLAVVLLWLVNACTWENDQDQVNTGTNTPQCDTSFVPTFDAHIQPIINTSCALSGCHASGSFLPTFQTYQQVLAQITVNDHANSEIYTRIENGTMPPASSSAPKPDACQIDLIKRWINNGAPQN